MTPAETAEILESVDAPPPPRKEADEGGSWKPDHNPTQEQAFNDAAETVFIEGEKGCRTGDTIIYTNNGLVRLAALKPKDAQPGKFSPIDVPVSSFGGRSFCPAKADGFWIEPGKEALKAVLQNGAEITGSPRHPLWVCWRAADGAHGFGYASLSDMAFSKEFGMRFWTPMVEHPGISTVEYQTVCGHAITSELAYAIGALVGDGSLNIFTGDNRCIGFTNQDSECVEAVKVGLSHVGCRLHLSNYCHYQYFVRDKSVFKNIIRELGIGHLSYFKRIPDQIIKSPLPVIASFLRGLFDTDGTVEKQGVVSLCTVSENLSRDVQDLLAAMGILAVRRPKKSASGNPTWTISVMGRHAYRYGQLIGFHITRKQQRISKPKISRLCPHGFNQNRYGFPQPICSVMRKISGSKGASKGFGRTKRDSLRHLHSFKSIPARPKVEAFSKIYNCWAAFELFLISDTWLEVQSVSQSSAELFDLHVPETHSFLASGTINHNSGKTIDGGDIIVRHAYENDNALVQIITKSIRTGAEGIWHDLETLVLPRWRDGNTYPPFIVRDDGTMVDHPQAGQYMDSGIGLEYTAGKLDPLTKDRHRWIRNRHGGWSKLLLISIPYASMVEDRIKGPAPSMVYVDELTNCEGPEYYTFPSAQLGRRRDITGPQQFVATMNPKGPSHWVYKLKEEMAGDPSFKCYHIPITENLHRLPRGYVERLKKLFQSNPVEYDRLIKGEWIDAPTGEALFSGYFIPQLHVKGDAKRGLGLSPIKGFPIIISYDLGQIWNCATFMQLVPLKDGRMVWIVFDEVHHLGDRILYSNMARECVKRIEFWRRRVGYEFAVMQYAGDDSISQHRPGTGSYDSTAFEKEFVKAFKKKCKIIGCPRGAGSIAARVQLVQAKLTQEEIIISATCTGTIQMFNLLESNPEHPMEPRAKSKYGHPFDALSYAMFKVELNGVARLQTTSTPTLLVCGSR